MAEKKLICEKISDLFRQYDLRIAYAEGKAALYDEERKRFLAEGKKKVAALSKESQTIWEIYAKNMGVIKGRVVEAVSDALSGYGQTRKLLWTRYFLGGESSYELCEEFNMSARHIRRVINAMKREMELKFDFPLPMPGDLPQWSAEQLAGFLTDKPSEEYISALKDAMEYGIIDFAFIERDPDFQEYMKGNRP